MTILPKTFYRSSANALKIPPGFFTGGIYIKMQEPGIVKTILQKKVAYHESPERNPYTCGQLIFHKDAKRVQWRTEQSSTDGAGITWYLCGEGAERRKEKREKEFEPLPHTIIKH